MRTEQDFLGELQIPKDALYGIHSLRAQNNFPDNTPFHKEWYSAMGLVKQACYHTIQSFKKAVTQKYPNDISKLNLPSNEVIETLIQAAIQVSQGEYFEHFIVPAIQGGAGTSINMNVNEIITNASLKKLEHKPGNYTIIDPIEQANLYQSTNDVVPTALKVATMQLLNSLEDQINQMRTQVERLEKTYRNSMRTGYTQLQQAVPSSFGQLFGAYNDALSRDWWRVSKCSERIKTVNLGGGATGSGIAIPRFFIIEVVGELKKLTGLPITQSENLTENTSNQDSFVEVHAILKAHAVTLEKMVNDIRLLGSDILGNKELQLPAKQAGSSIMPGKVNPVITEFVISAVQKIYANDALITNLAAKGNLELNAYIPSIGHALLESLKLLIACDETIEKNLLSELIVLEDNAKKTLYKSPSVCTALSPIIGYHKAAELTKYMKENKCNIFEANIKLNILNNDKLNQYMQPSFLLQKGFSVKDLL
ncbi:MAG: lyase family protein [Salinivirgaceae bacterium]|jgi:aspartate ammonia-lyase|nr:lyase family protein [Salinivirgaceae bacterium]